jgi:Zn-dependent hydrolases, including glyoxylases
MDQIGSINLIPGTTAHCYDVSIDHKRYLIDAGMKGSGRKIVEYYNRLNAKPDVVLITHYHPDHIGGLSFVKESFNPSIFVPDGEIEVVRGRAHVVPARSFRSRYIASMLKTNPVEDVIPISALTDENVHVISTAGHTPDSRSYHFPSLNAIFVGDSALINKGVIDINKAFTLDYSKAMKAIDSLKKMRGTVAYPGHGASYTIGQ